MLSGLFQRAIMESGSLFNPYWMWQTREDAVRLSTFMAEKFDCSDLTAPGQLQCLQALDPEVRHYVPSTYHIFMSI